MTELYVASQIKRSRSTQDEVMDRRSRLYTIVSEMRPMTVRQVFYQATVRGVVHSGNQGEIQRQSG